MALAETARLVASLELKDGLTPGLNRARASMAGFSAGVKQLGTGVGQVGAGLGRIASVAAVGFAAGIGVAVKSAIDFQASMKLIQTQAGASAAEVDSMSTALLGLAPAVGSTPEELAAGLFHVESAGFRGAQALDVLKLAAEGAKVGNADLESVTNALIAALASGVGGIKDSSEAMGVLNATVGAGNIRMEDLAASFGTGVLSAAKNFGVSIQSVGAAIADLAVQGIPAIDAATRLRMTMSLLAAPTSKAVGLLGDIGISATQLADDMRGPDGILGAVADLKDHLDASGLSATEQAALLSRAFGGGRSSSALLALIGDVDRLRTTQDQVNASTGKFPEAWEAAQKDVKIQLDKLFAGLKSAGITIGVAILPKLTPLVDKLSKFLAENQAGIGEFGAQLADAFANIPWSELMEAGKLLGMGARALLTAFTSLPPWVQTAVLTGWGLNKLSGGLLGQGLGNILGGLRQLAQQKLVPQTIGPYVGEPIPVFVVNMGVGGLGGGGLGTAAAGAAGAGTLAVVAGVAAAVVGGLVVGGFIGGPQQEQIVAPARAFENTQVAKLINQSSTTHEDLTKAINVIDTQLSDVNSNLMEVAAAGSSEFAGIFTGQKGVITTLKEQRAALVAKLEQLDQSTQDNASEFKKSRATLADLQKPITAQLLAIQRADAAQRGANNVALAAQAVATEKARLIAANTAESARWNGIAASAAARAASSGERTATESANIARYTAIDAAKPAPNLRVDVRVNTSIAISNVVRQYQNYVTAGAGSGPGGAPAAELL